MNQNSTIKGFTLIEIIVVLLILGIIVSISASAFARMYRESARKAGASEVYGALISARSRTLAAQNDTTHGVLVSSTTVTRFQGGAYSPSDTTNRSYTFEGGVTATGTLVTSETPIIFTRLSGKPNSPGILYVRNDDGTSTTTITVSASGLIEYD